MSRVLIGYATKTGSTKEVAERICKIMIDKGHKVDIKPLETVKDLSDYESIVIGAPVNGMMWRPDALEFVKSHKQELDQRKVVYFTLAMMAHQGRSMWQKRVQKALNKPSALVTPIDTAIFGGVAGDDIPAPLRVLFGIPKDSASDQRDWNRIDSWANDIAAKL